MSSDKNSGSSAKHSSAAQSSSVAQSHKRPLDAEHDSDVEILEPEAKHSKTSTDAPDSYRMKRAGKQAATYKASHEQYLSQEVLIPQLQAGTSGSDEPLQASPGGHDKTSSSSPVQVSTSSSPRQRDEYRVAPHVYLSGERISAAFAKLGGLCKFHKNQQFKKHHYRWQQVAGTFAGKKKLYNENEAINAAGGGQDTMEMIEIMFKEGQIFCNSGKETKIIEDI